VQARNAFGHFRRDLPFQENEVPARVGEALFDFLGDISSNAPQTRKLPSLGCTSPGIAQMISLEC